MFLSFRSSYGLIWIFHQLHDSSVLTLTSAWCWLACKLTIISWKKKNLWWLLGGEVTVMVLGTSRLSADYLRHSVLLWQLMRLHGGTSHELPGNCSQLSWGMLRNGDPNTQVGHINIRTSTLPSAQALLTSSLKSSVEPVCNCTASG